MKKWSEKGVKKGPGEGGPRRVVGPSTKASVQGVYRPGYTLNMPTLDLGPPTELRRVQSQQALGAQCAGSVLRLAEVTG